MENLLNKMVEVTYTTGATISGVVVDINPIGDVIWVKSNTDLHKVTTQDLIREVKAPIVFKTPEDEFEAFLNSKNIKWEGFGESGSTFYHILGCTYTLQITISEDGFHYCETTHKGRYYKESDLTNPDSDTDKASGNRVIRKTLKGVKSYVTQWVSK